MTRAITVAWTFLRSPLLLVCRPSLSRIRRHSQFRPGLLRPALTALLLALLPASHGTEPVPLEMPEPSDRAGKVRAFPVSVGMVFLEGEIPRAPGGAVVDDLGTPVPFDWEVTGWWSPEKTSVKWLLLHFKASGDRQYAFVPGAAPMLASGRPLAVAAEGAVEIDTGPLRARLLAGNAPVFESVILNGRSMLEPGASFFEMVDDEGRALRCEDWKLSVEENTPLRAVIRGEGSVGLAGSPPLANVSVRYQFFAGESFARLYHTFVWLERSLEPGLNRIAVRLRPELAGRLVARVGLSDVTGEAKESVTGPETDLVAYQDAAEHFTIREDGREVAGGRRLGGWISVEGEDGRGVGVSLKNAWQTFPTTLAMRRGDLEVGLWPEEAGRFSFEERDIMPDSLYYDEQWGRQVAWTRQGGPTLFNTRDIEPKAARSFVEALKTQSAAAAESPGKRIVSFLPSELQTRIREWRESGDITDGLRARLAHGMNAFLEKPDFYDPASWAGVELKPKASELLAKGLQDLKKSELVWLNRLLVESAFPDAISPSDVPHFIHENSQLVNGGGFVQTGEGASRTHELTVLFHDGDSPRTPAQLNSLTQHPFVMRQSPAHALRVPLFGFHFSPANREKHPDIERALEHFGDASVSRYAETHDFGFLRFGMQRMNHPGEGLYRWAAGMQYNQQIIPWLLFLRGADRRFYEEAMNTAAYAADMHVNHHKRGGTPGSMSFVAGMPMPEGGGFAAYNMKVNFLALCHHLTGYRRAKEAMELGIEGTKKSWVNLRSDPVARQLYGMNSYFADAYEETLDPGVKELARRTLDKTLDTHYDPVANVFAGNSQYLYKGLVPLQAIFPEARLRDTMLKHLAGCGLPGLEWAGPTAGPADQRAAIMLIGAAWAYEQTKDERHARILWDVTRTLADIAPDHDWASPVPVAYPKGHFAAYCHRVLPMLAGLGVVDRNGLEFPRQSCLHDLFVAHGQPGGTGIVHVRALQDGDLLLRLRGIAGADKARVEISARRHGSEEALAVSYLEKSSRNVLPALRTSTTTTHFEGELTIPAAKKDEIYQLDLKGSDSTVGILVLSDNARIVHRISSDTIQFYGHSYQYYLGTRVFAKMDDDVLRLTRNRPEAAFTIRDALTHEILSRSRLLDPLTTEHRIGKDRMIEIVLGAGRDTNWKLEGIRPFVSARAQDWFSPE